MSKRIVAAWKVLRGEWNAYKLQQFYSDAHSTSCGGADPTAEGVHVNVTGFESRIERAARRAVLKYGDALERLSR